MILYHGTSTKNLADILKNGIQPRGKRKGNWGNSVTSHSDCVYLTTAYPIYFAGAACTDQEDLLVLEVDANQLNCLPDEDFLEQVTRKRGPAPIEWTIKKRTLWYRNRLRDFAHHTGDSINGLGTAAHFGAVSPDAITRYATISHSACENMIVQGNHDPVISVSNYQFLSHKYANWVKWLFDPGDDSWPRAGVEIHTRR